MDKAAYARKNPLPEQSPEPELRACGRFVGARAHKVSASRRLRFQPQHTCWEWPVQKELSGKGLVPQVPDPGSTAVWDPWHHSQVVALWTTKGTEAQLSIQAHKFAI